MGSSIVQVLVLLVALLAGWLACAADSSRRNSQRATKATSCEEDFANAAATVDFHLSPDTDGMTRWQTIDALRPGSILHFGNGKQFKIVKVLSVEGSNGVFEIEDGRVLRVPKMGTLKGFREGYLALVKAGVPVPKMLWARAKKEYIVSEKLDILFGLEDVLRADSKIPNGRANLLKEAFGRFAEKFRDFNSVSDFGMQQIVYDRKRGWVLLDWLGGHQFGHELNPFLMIGFLKDRIGPTEFNPARMVEWRRATNEALARARNQPLNHYDGMTEESISKILYGEDFMKPPAP